MRVLLLNQPFYPDVVSTAQHTSDLARALVERGHEVTVIASSRAYDSPEVRYPARETWEGIQIQRIWATGFGKSAKWKRVADFATFSLSLFFRLLFVRRADVVIALTTPPWLSFLAALLVKARGGKLVYWVMDMNPDAAIAAGFLSADSPAAQALEWMSRFSLRQSSSIIALDRFMAERLERKGIPAEKISVLPPWAHTESVVFNPVGREEFRREHGLTDKFVIMYSGNHSPVHPLTTLLEAALVLRNDPQFQFCFIGGGSEFKRVQRFAAEHQLQNVLCLPYQPLATLSSSLSAADLHTIVMGNAFVGIVHPCKAYNVMTLGTPLLYVGPLPSHVGDVFEQGGEWAYVAIHGDVDQVVAHIRTAARRRMLDIPAEQETARRFGPEELVPPHVAIIETGRVTRFSVLRGAEAAVQR